MKHRRPKRTVALACGVLLAMASCTHEKTVPPELAGVYERIVSAREDHERGVALILDGEDVAGENLLRAASTRMAVAIRECVRTPGCDRELIADSVEQIAEGLASGAIEGQNAAVPGRGRIDVHEPGTPADADQAEPMPVSSAIDEASLLRGTDLRDLIPSNPRVRAQVNAWLTWKRPELLDAYRNYGFLRAAIVPEYEAARLPEALLFGMMATESGGKVHAYSRAGAAGPLQFMPRTARRYGLYAVDGFDTRLDPVRATRANARYVVDHLRRLRGNLELTLAAYNAGETRLARLHRRHPEAEFWDPEIYYALPSETRTYVPRVLAAALLFLDSGSHGVAFPDGEATVTTVRLGTDASLGELAVCLGNEPGGEGWFRTLRNLNPAVSPGDRIPAGTRISLPTAAVAAYGQRCVGPGSWTALARTLHDADYPEKPEVVRYVVRGGDSLALIAAEHHSSVREIALLNAIRAPYVIHPGQILEVPARR